MRDVESGFDSHTCFVQDRQTGTVLGTGRRRRDRQGLYILDRLHLPSTSVAPITSTSTATAATTSGVFAQ